MTLMPTRISADEVAHVARLARLALTPEELERFTEQLGAVLAHAQDVEALDTAGVPPTAHPLPLTNVLREDVLVPCLVEDVEAVESAGVPPTAHPLPLSNVLREDVVVPCLDRDEVLAQAPDV